MLLFERPHPPEAVCPPRISTFKIQYSLHFCWSRFELGFRHLPPKMNISPTPRHPRSPRQFISKRRTATDLVSMTICPVKLGRPRMHNWNTEPAVKFSVQRFHQSIHDLGPVCSLPFALSFQILYFPALSKQLGSPKYSIIVCLFFFYYK